VRFVGTPALPNLDWVLTLNTRSSAGSRAPRSSSGGATRTSSSGRRATSCSRRSTPPCVPPSGCAWTCSTSSSASRGRATERGLDPPHPARPARVPGGAPGVRAPRRPVHRRGARLAARRLPHQRAHPAAQPDGTFSRPGGRTQRQLPRRRAVQLAAHPGTVFFAGYGSTLADPRETASARCGACRTGSS
jgi:hypothetical protein